MITRFTQVSSAHVFLFRGKQVLLARRFQTGYEDGNYSVPAGHVDEGETVSQAAIREAYEEAGVVISPENLEYGHVMHRIGDRESLDFFFVCHTWQNEPTNAEPDKCDELRWVDIDDLPKNTIPYLRTALKHVLDKNPYSEFGW